MADMAATLETSERPVQSYSFADRIPCRSLVCSNPRFLRFVFEPRVRLFLVVQHL
jgi:hypothetical protein